MFQCFFKEEDTITIDINGITQRVKTQAFRIPKNHIVKIGIVRNYIKKGKKK